MRRKITYAFTLGALLTMVLFLINGPIIERKGPIYIDVKECGAVGNGIADDTWAIQKAVDSGMKTRLWVYVPPGIYKITKTIIGATRASNGNYAQSFLKIMGEDTKHSPGISIIRPTFKDAPALALHLNKGSIIKGIYFDGAYRSPNIPLDSLYRSPIDKYGDSTCRDSRYSPYTAIAIDPFRYNLPPDSGYPTLRSWYGGQTAVSGSTGITIEHCTFKNFTIGAIVSPNGHTLNAELITFRDIRVNDCKFAFVGCQAQEKDNLLEGWEIWGKVRCAFVWGKYGAGQPGDYKVNRANIAGNVVEIVFRPSQGFFPLDMYGIFAENVKGVGYWNTSLTDALRSSTINLYYYRYLNGFSDDNLNGNGVTLRDTHIRYYGQFKIPALIKGTRVTYQNSPNGFNYTNPIKGWRYWPTDADYNNGFSIRKIHSDTLRGLYYENRVRYVVLSKTTDSAKAGDIAVFYQASNLDYRGMGEVVSADSGKVKIGYISAGVPNNMRITVGIYQSGSPVDTTSVH